MTKTEIRKRWKELGDLHRDACERSLLETLSDGREHWLYGDKRALGEELMERGWIAHGLWHKGSAGFSFRITYEGRTLLVEKDALSAELKARYDAAKRAVWRA